MAERQATSYEIKPIHSGNRVSPLSDVGRMLQSQSSSHAFVTLRSGSHARNDHRPSRDPGCEHSASSHAKPDRCRCLAAMLAKLLRSSSSPIHTRVVYVLAPDPATKRPRVGNNSSLEQFALAFCGLCSRPSGTCVCSRGTSSRAIARAAVLLRGRLG